LALQGIFSCSPVVCNLDVKNVLIDGLHCGSEIQCNSRPRYYCVRPHVTCFIIKKGKGFPYSLPSIGPGADPGVQAVSPKVTTISHPPGGRLPLLSAGGIGMLVGPANNVLNQHI